MMLEKDSSATRDGEDDLASFGFKDIPASDKSRMVKGVFDSVAGQYDMMNDLMSGGVHRIWKSVLLDRLAPQPGRTLLDMAGGTGDVARSYLARAASRPNSHGAKPATAFVCDINHEMLRAGRRDEAALGLAYAGARVCGDAEHIPLPDNSVDVYTISFGIRNVTHLDAALSEARRVLRYGGRFVCLEFSHMITEPLQKLYDLYSFNVIPWLGEQAVGDRESYQYLVESIRRFPDQRRGAEGSSAAGVVRVDYETLIGGVAALHYGAKA